MSTELYGFEIIRQIPDPRDDQKHIQCSMIVAARGIKQVWEYLSGDLADERTEVERIARFGPIVAVLDWPVPIKTTEALRNFVEAIEQYDTTGTWPDNGTLRRLADEGREALNCSIYGNPK